MRSSVFNLFSLFLLNGSIAVLGFLTQAGIANALGGELFGRYSFYLAISAYTAAAVRFGRERTMLRDLLQHPGDSDRIVSATMQLSLLVAGIIALIFCLGNIFDPESVPPEMLLLIFGITLVSFDLQPLYDSKGLMWRHALYNAVYRCVYFSLVWGLIYFSPWKLNITWIGLALIIGICVSLSIQFFELKPRFGIDLTLKPVPRELAKLAKHGSPVAMVSVLELVYGPLLLIFLSYHCDERTVGIVNIAGQFMYATTIIWQQVARIGNPVMTRLVDPVVPFSTIIYTSLKYAGVLCLFLAPCSILMIFFPERLVLFFFSREYLSAAEIIPIYGRLLFLFPLNIIAMQYVIAARLDRAYMFGVIFTASCGSVVSWFLIKNFGLFGAAWGYSTTIVTGTVINSVLMVKAFRARKVGKRGKVKNV